MAHFLTDGHFKHGDVNSEAVVLTRGRAPGDGPQTPKWGDMRGTPSFGLRIMVDFTDYFSGYAHGWESDIFQEQKTYQNQVE